MFPGLFLSGGLEGPAGGVVWGVEEDVGVLGVSGELGIVESGTESESESESSRESSDGGEGIVSNCASRAAMSAGAGVSTTTD